MVTEMFQMFRVYQPTGFMPQKLYYVTFPESLFSKPVPPFPGMVASVDDNFITTIIPAKDGLAAAALAVDCYKSQYTPEVMKGLNNMMEKVLAGNIYRQACAFPESAFHRGRTRPVYGYPLSANNCRDSLLIWVR